MAATAKTTIELNGKLYDARTGKIIGDADEPRQVQHTLQARPARSAAPAASGTVLDGFVRSKATRPSVSRTAAAHAPSKLQKSNTLMRPAVKKPAKLVSHSEHSHPVSYKKTHPERHVRAAVSEKSDRISRFVPNVSAHKVIKREAELPVATPAHAAPAHAPAVTVGLAASVVSTKVAHLATSTEAHLVQSVDIIEESLRNASAHLQQFDDRHIRKGWLHRFGFRNKAANLTALSVAAFLLIGFFAYQNAPNIEMRVAAAKAGIPAGMPGYKPAGFAAERGIKNEPGKVSVTFRSNTDDKKFTIAQQASNWSSDSLLTNHVIASKQPYQTYQDEGKTVYIYDNSSATWVNGGIWYKLDGDASLTSDQLLRIANSL